MSADTPYDKLRHFLPEADEVGIDGYDLLQPLGEGGFGRVFLARQNAFGRNVAIKVLSAVGLQQDTAERFERECRAVGALSAHPNIVTIYDSGITSWGRPYIVMEHMAGGSLAQRVALEGPLQPEAALDMIVKIAGAVAVAHTNGIVHRDIKPENVLISSYGEPVLADFGVASIPDGYRTNTGAITASLAHAAPEVMDGAGAAHASDVYSLGSTLFTLLAGRAPFESPERPGLQALIARTMTQPVPDLRLSGIPHEVCVVVEKALAKDPAHRFASMEELAAALQQAQESLGLQVTRPVLGGFEFTPLAFEASRDEAKTIVRARKATAPAVAPPPRRRRTLTAPALTAVILVAATLGAGGTLATKIRRPSVSAARQPTGAAVAPTRPPTITGTPVEQPDGTKRVAGRGQRRSQRRSPRDAGRVAFAAGPGGGSGNTVGSGSGTTHSTVRSGGYKPAAASSSSSSGSDGGPSGSGGGGTKNAEPASPAPPPAADTLLYHLYSEDGSYYFTTSMNELNEKTYSYDSSHREAVVWSKGTQKMRRICYGDGRCGGWVYIQKPSGITTRPLYVFTGPHGDYYTTNKNEIPEQYADRYVYLFGYAQ